ncbi:MAG: hypothetical protein AAFU03_15700, partial [Bacteroidota bacterium]
MKRLFQVILVSCCLSGSSTYGQTDSLFATNVEQVFVDPVGQLILLQEGSRLTRLDVATDSTYFFYNNLLGQISDVDVSDPFGPLLFFRDFQIILFFDRTLSERGRLDLREIEEVQQAELFCRSFDDKIWVYDEWDYRIKLVNEQGRIIEQTDDLQRALRISATPNFIKAKGNYLFAHYPERGLAVFSSFGQFLRWETLPQGDHLQWTNDGLYIWNNETCWRWNGHKSE